MSCPMAIYLLCCGRLAALNYLRTVSNDGSIIVTQFAHQSMAHLAKYLLQIANRNKQLFSKLAASHSSV